MKNLLKTTLLLLTFTFMSCNTDVEDHVTGDAQESGAIVKKTVTVGKALGVPLTTDLANTAVNFTDTVLDLEISLQFGGAGVSKYEIVKSLNGGQEAVVASGANLPLSVNYSSIADFYANTAVSNSDELRIGDIFTFKTKMHTDSGVIYAGNNGTYAVKIACSSALASLYQVTTTRVSDGAQWDQGIEDILEINPGVYTTETTGGWSKGQLRPFQGYIFEDSCNSISLPSQTLFEYYSNKVYQTEDQLAASMVDGDTGNMHIEYTIEFASGDTGYACDYIKQ